MRALLPLALLVAGCSTTWDPHAPGTIVVEKAGEVRIDHGQRLQIRLPLAASGSEWRRREPMTMAVLAEGLIDRNGVRMTPVRSGKETLRIEELPVDGSGPAQRSFTYEITVE
jgi:hypothetical protein